LPEYRETLLELERAKSSLETGNRSVEERRVELDLISRKVVMRLFDSACEKVKTFASTESFSIIYAVGPRFPQEENILELPGGVPIYIREATDITEAVIRSFARQK